MTGKEDLSYRKITENIAGKLDLLEAYLFYCLALCSDCLHNGFKCQARGIDRVLWNKERRTDKAMVTQV